VTSYFQDGGHDVIAAEGYSGLSAVPDPSCIRTCILIHLFVWLSLLVFCLFFVNLHLSVPRSGTKNNI